MDRKDFIKTCGFACLSGTLVATLLQSCAGTNYFAKTAADNNLIIVKKSEFIKDEKKGTKRRFVLVRTDKYPFPISVFRHKEDDFSALLMECSHKGCELELHGDYLICPCHGSEFTNKGIVQNPPAEENLKTFTVVTDNETIYIQL